MKTLLTNVIVLTLNQLALKALDHAWEQRGQALKGCVPFRSRPSVWQS
jgi:hypothetical protein